MLYLYLDESGDLGFDFVNRKPSHYFTVTIMAIKGHEQNRAVAAAARLTLRRKVKAPRFGRSDELKGSRDNLSAKKYFYAKIERTGVKIFAVTLDKKRLLPYLVEDKDRIYNYISRLVMEKVSLEDSKVRVILTVDKSKTRHGRRDFDDHIVAQVKSRLDPKIPLEIFHRSSQESPQLQAADLFSWGIFRKYERQDTEWFRLFREKVVFEGLYSG